MKALPFIKEIVDTIAWSEGADMVAYHVEKIMSLYNIPLEFSLLDCEDWLPGEDAKEMMGEEEYNKQIESYQKNLDKVLFKNTRVTWESCDCGEEYGCPHGSWVDSIKVGYFVFELFDEDQYSTVNLSIYMPKTIGEFIDDCYRSKIDLEWSDSVVEKYFKR